MRKGSMSKNMNLQKKEQQNPKNFNEKKKLEPLLFPCTVVGGYKANQGNHNFSHALFHSRMNIVVIFFVSQKCE